MSHVPPPPPSLGSLCTLKGFARWLNFMRADRKRIHDNICKDCSPRDFRCVKSRYQRIMAIQREIAQARTDYTDLVTKCDKCAPLRLRFERWVKVQTARRQRLHAEICKCEDTDVKCVVRRVMRIKRIQQRIKSGRKHIFHLNEHCDDNLLVPATAPPTAAPTTTAISTSAPAIRAASASVSLAGFASLLAVALALAIL